MICETSPVKMRYKLAVVENATESADGVVRSALIRYCNIVENPKGEDKVTIVRVTRSVQRLVLIMPVEEMEDSVNVEEHEHFVKCVVGVKAGVL